MLKNKYLLNLFNTNFSLRTNRRLSPKILEEILLLYKFYTQDLDPSFLDSSSRKFLSSPVGLSVKYNLIFFNFLLWIIKNNQLLSYLGSEYLIDTKHVFLEKDLFITKLKKCFFDFKSLVYIYILESIYYYLVEQKNLEFYISTNNYIVFNKSNPFSLSFSDGFSFYSNKDFRKGFYLKIDNFQDQEFIKIRGKFGIDTTIKLDSNPFLFFSENIVLLKVLYLKSLKMKLIDYEFLKNFNNSIKHIKL